MESKDFLSHIQDNIEYSDTYTGINKEELFKLCQEKGLKVPPKKMVKSDIIKYLNENGVSWSEFYARWKHCTFGIHPTLVEKKFNLNKRQRKKMEESGFLRIAYKVKTKVFTNTYADVPYYDAERYYTLTMEDTEEWKVNNIRGYKKKAKEDEGVGVHLDECGEDGRRDDQ